MASVTWYAPAGWRRLSLNRLMTREIQTQTSGPVASQAGVIGALQAEQMRFGTQGRPDITFTMTLARQYGSPKGTGFNVMAAARTSLPR
jgi:hypothetical protein